MGTHRHPERLQDIRNVEAREQVRPKARRHCNGGVETSTLTEQPRAKRVNREKKRKHGQRERQAGGPVVGPKDLHAAGGHPVHQGWLVKEADAVDVGRDVVMPLHHLTRRLDVDRIHIVQQPRREQAAEMQHAPEQDQRRNRPLPRTLHLLVRRLLTVQERRYSRGHWHQLLICTGFGTARAMDRLSALP